VQRAESEERLPPAGPGVMSGAPGFEPVPRLRFGLCAAILLVSATIFYFLSLRLISQAHYLRAKNLTQEENYGPAVNLLEKAHVYGPKDAEILIQLGVVYSRIGDGKSAPRETFRFMEKAKQAYLEAALLNPLEVEIAYGLAKTEWRLKHLYQNLYPEDASNPYHPGPYFENTLRLRPNGIFYNYAFARYLYKNGTNDKFLEIIRTLAGIYPSAYNDLKRESFWSPSVKEAVKEGLLKAIEEKSSLRNAHRVLSSLLSDDEEWAEAIGHYRESLLYSRHNNTPEDYIHLGRLYLKNGQTEEAQKSFFDALDRSSAKEKDLEALYSIYKKEGHLDELYRFYQTVNRRYILSSRIQILLARSLMDMQQFDQARQILIDLNRQKPTAEAYYWLARVAEIEKDWDRMELAIQKATVLDPQNSGYWRMFIGLLKRLRRFETAEWAINQANKNSKSPSWALINERAQIRWAQKNYSGALDDWRQAIGLAPQVASLYAQAAEASIKLGAGIQALGYYEKAIALEPKNKGYAKRYLELKSKLTAES